MPTTYSIDPALYIFTSLTAGSSHIVTATSRLETILRANRVPFKAVDIATDARARMLWGRRAGKDNAGRLRKLPGLVQEAVVLGDLVEIEDWNEYGELKQHVKIYYDEHTIPSIHDKPPDPPKPKQKASAKPKAAPAASTAPPSKASSSAPSASSKPKLNDQGQATDHDQQANSGKGAPLAVRSVADEAAQKAKELHLRTLREKVHGKDAASDAVSPVSASKAEPVAASGQSDTRAASQASAAVPDAGLQSPISGTWKDWTPATGASELAQSPTSGRWQSRSDHWTAPTSQAAATIKAGSTGKQASETAVALQQSRETEAMSRDDREGAVKHEADNMDNVDLEATTGKETKVEGSGEEKSAHSGEGATEKDSHQKDKRQSEVDEGQEKRTDKQGNTFTTGDEDRSVSS